MLPFDKDPLVVFVVFIKDIQGYESAQINYAPVPTAGFPT